MIVQLLVVTVFVLHVLELKVSFSIQYISTKWTYSEAIPMHRQALDRIVRSQNLLVLRFALGSPTLLLPSWMIWCWSECRMLVREGFARIVRVLQCKCCLEVRLKISMIARVT